MRIHRICWIRRIFWKCVTKRIRETNLLKIDWICDSQYETNLLKSGFVIHNTVRIHGFVKQIHVFTNLLYESRNLRNLAQQIVTTVYKVKLHSSTIGGFASISLCNKTLTTTILTFTKLSIVLPDPCLLLHYWLAAVVFLGVFETFCSVPLQTTPRTTSYRRPDICRNDSADNFYAVRLGRGLL